jgi:hypothetical protein
LLDEVGWVRAILPDIGFIYPVPISEIMKHPGWATVGLSLGLIAAMIVFIYVIGKI